ncbi:MAG: PSD1 domain-containing protein [Armatimonadetes bacterium]|nr:PSD1 domain-containing protein [Armatimonadota bacterium]
MKPVRVQSVVLTALSVSVLAVGLAGARTPSAASKKATFEDDVLPVFKAHCFSCHTGAEAAAGLDLTRYESVIKGGASGQAVVAGKPDESLLTKRIVGTAAGPQMPMGFAPLSAAKIKAVRDWIAQGAAASGEKRAHWAYVAPKLPALPKVKDAKWPRGPLDRFILARLEKEGLKPSPEATKAALARRLFLDLTGLPPSPEAVAAFEADRRPDAYERLVDKLLASEHYGERMARPWLDLSRYADSDGYEADANRVAWTYRDWVIDAFNRNMPYDRFSIEQIAGDMLPSATIDQKIATGFHRNSMFNREGGVDPGEAQFYVVMDRVSTVSTVWLGSTLACARCHDHKYDPFSQKDFYAMVTVFGNTDYEKAGDANVGQEKWYEPNIEVPSQDQTVERDKLKKDLADADKDLAAAKTASAPAFQAWLTGSERNKVWTAPSDVTVSTVSGEVPEKLEDGSFLFTGPPPANDTYELTFTTGTPVTALRLEALPDSRLTMNGPGRSVSGNFILTNAVVAADTSPVPVSQVLASYTQGGYDPSRIAEAVPAGSWAVYGAIGKPSEIAFVLKSPIRPGRYKVSLSFGSKEWPQHLIGRLRLTTTTSPAPYVVPMNLQEALAKPARSKSEDDALFAFFQSVTPQTQALAQKRSQTAQALAKLEASIPKAMVVRERPTATPLVGNLHLRGEYLSKGDPVTAATPASLPPMPKAAPVNRLTVAKWLVSRENPLSARVEVNRLWELVFGRGLVETSEDFGTQGARPSHPELLDWLAVTFMEEGWDVKATMKRIVMSATYRQSSAATPDLLARDPKNVLLARGARYRMEAEMIRDNALTIGGLLSSKVGGPSVFPTQPDGVWDTPYNGEQWATSTRGDQYRRGLYTFWKRSSTYPAFMSFDATSREACTVRRLTTNTPLQALGLLNDQVSMDAARGLARRTGGVQAKARVSAMFRTCTARIPTEEESARLLKLYARLKDRYDKDPEAAAKLAKTPDDAAWTMVANTLLNLDETITRN